MIFFLKDLKKQASTFFLFIPYNTCILSSLRNLYTLFLFKIKSFQSSTTNYNLHHPLKFISQSEDGTKRNSAPLQERQQNRYLQREKWNKHIIYEIQFIILQFTRQSIAIHGTATKRAARINSLKLYTIRLKSNPVASKSLQRRFFPPRTIRTRDRSKYCQKESGCEGIRYTTLFVFVEHAALTPSRPTVSPFSDDKIYTRKVAREIGAAARENTVCEQNRWKFLDGGTLCVPRLEIARMKHRYAAVYDTAVVRSAIRLGCVS